MQEREALFSSILSEAYALKPRRVLQVRGGWSALAYRVETASGTFFLKVYDKEMPSIRQWTARMYAYLPALDWLCGRPSLRARIVEPVRTTDGRHWHEDERYYYALARYIEGETVGARPLSQEEAESLAALVAALHQEAVPLPTEYRAGLAEDLSLPFCARLSEYLDAPQPPNALWQVLCPEQALLRQAVGETLALRDTVRQGAKDIVLCHTDIHGWNLIEGDALILVDWEGLLLAPPEADLFAFEGSPHWSAVLEAYGRARPGFRLREDMLRYYLLRRRIEDIWDFIARILEDGPPEAEAERILRLIEKEIKGTRRLMNSTRTL